MSDLVDAVDIEWPYTPTKATQQTRCECCLFCECCMVWVMPGAQLFRAGNPSTTTACEQCAYQTVVKKMPYLIRAVRWHETPVSDKAQAVIEASGGVKRVGQLIRHDGSLGHVTVCVDSTVVLVHPPLTLDRCGGFTVHESIDAMTLPYRECEFVEDL